MGLAPAFYVAASACGVVAGLAILPLIRKPAPFHDGKVPTWKPVFLPGLLPAGGVFYAAGTGLAIWSSDSGGLVVSLADREVGHCRLLLWQFHAPRAWPSLQGLDINFTRPHSTLDSQRGGCPGCLSHLDAVWDDIEHWIGGMIGWETATSGEKPFQLSRHQTAIRHFDILW
jgi:hypothetical protein